MSYGSMSTFKQLVSELLEDTRVPSGTPHRYKEDINSQAAGSNPEPFCCEVTELSTKTPAGKYDSNAYMGSNTHSKRLPGWIPSWGHSM